MHLARSCFTLSCFAALLRGFGTIAGWLSSPLLQALRLLANPLSLLPALHDESAVASDCSALWLLRTEALLAVTLAVLCCLAVRLTGVNLLPKSGARATTFGSAAWLGATSVGGFVRFSCRVFLVLCRGC